ncbi:alpha/beta hydrolase [Rhizorhabdus dicambivorans]|uniref:Esterase n=1 Tax=Rhizorhabdus dicambivorans TaxID=1850238 RepID=A0A2A4FYE6_9SPHN|nr:esterase [Rhizorhabdus dicambivorans]ATE63635.1 esterase [Rhizorhabdus dicambivorans]PCE42761.1 esterase [Rhizorhabdus dicambivorans]
MSREEAVVIRYDAPDREGGRDIVYLHGRGSSEREAGWALPLFGRSTVRSYRGPLPEGAGFAWFHNMGIGVAAPDSLAEQSARVGDWIAADRGGRLPWLCGFSNGAAMAAALMLADPGAYAGLVMIGGCFAVPARNLPAGALSGKPVLFCRGREDMVIPLAKFREAEAYLTGPSNAHASVLIHDGGHELPLPVASRVRNWLDAADH